MCSPAYIMKVLQVRFDAGGDVGEGFAVGTAARGAEPGEVVLGRAHVAAEATGRPSRAPSGRRRCPSGAPAPRRGACIRVATPVEARVGLWVARMQVRHQASRRGTGRDFIGVGNLDLGEVGRSGWYEDGGGKSNRERCSEESLHENTRCERGAAFLRLRPTKPTNVLKGLTLTAGLRLAGRLMQNARMIRARVGATRERNCGVSIVYASCLMPPRAPLSSGVGRRRAQSSDRSSRASRG